jgi:hypothetical protein
MSYQPIENYGIIGNMRTVALVSMNDSIERSAACRSLYRSEFILLQFISWGRDSCSGFVFACGRILDGLAWCPWCPLTSEFGSTGLKQATQANRLNLRKATKHAGFR